MKKTFGDLMKFLSVKYSSEYCVKITKKEEKKWPMKS